MAVVKALWDSWAADAIVDDRAGGIYARADRIRPINHRGDFYQVAGPLNMPRCPQGRPVLVQAGSSDTGRRFAARHAEAVFTAHMAKATAQEFYADLKRLAAAEGRNPEHVLILPGLSPMLASTAETLPKGHLYTEPYFFDVIVHGDHHRAVLAGRLGQLVEQRQPAAVG